MNALCATFHMHFADKCESFAFVTREVQRKFLDADYHSKCKRGSKKEAAQTLHAFIDAILFRSPSYRVFFALHNFKYIFCNAAGIYSSNI